MKPIIRLEEEVKLTGATPNQTITCLAKIDTGARTSSIDISLAEALGYNHIFAECQAALQHLKITPERYEALKTEVAELVPSLRQRIPGLVDVQVIKAANGISVRPFVALQLAIQNHTITTQVSIADRRHMTYRMLVGKADLGDFLIDPSQSNQ